MQSLSLKFLFELFEKSPLHIESIRFFTHHASGTEIGVSFSVLLLQVHLGWLTWVVKLSMVLRMLLNFTLNSHNLDKNIDFLLQ